MRKLTFCYDVISEKTNVNITSVSFVEELSDEDVKRLEESYRTGKFYNLNEDENLQDLFDQIHDTAIQMEEQEEYGELIGTEIELTNFRYPAEFNN